MEYSLIDEIACFSDLRWDFVHQGTQHLLFLFAAGSRVFYVGEPIFYEGVDKMEFKTPAKNVWVVVPHLQANAETHHLRNYSVR
jgi:hypothetical protein